MMNTREAAKWLGISASTLRNWRCQGKGPAFCTLSPRIVTYDLSDLERFKSERRCVPVPPQGHYAALQKSA